MVVAVAVVVVADCMAVDRTTVFGILVVVDSVVDCNYNQVDHFDLELHKAGWPVEQEQIARIVVVHREAADFGHQLVAKTVVVGTTLRNSVGSVVRTAVLAEFAALFHKKTINQKHYS